MKQLNSTTRPFRALSRLFLTSLGILLLSELAHATEEAGWSLNFTPVLILPDNDYGLGGGTDPELKLTRDAGVVRWSAGARFGGYYARDLWGFTAMPTLRVTLPLGAVDPYLSCGAGYGWLPSIDRDGLATMARVGSMFHFSEAISIGIEATLQQIHGTEFTFPSFGSMMSIAL